MEKKRNGTGKVILGVIFLVIAIFLSILGFILNLNQNNSLTSQNVSENTQNTPNIEVEIENTNDDISTINSNSTSEKEYLESPSSENISTDTVIVDNSSSETEPIISNAEEQSFVGTIYLTFDDGPSLEITSQILDILKEKDIKATFFILDYEYGSEKEALVCREISEGHTVGLHGTSHDYSTIYTSLNTLISNFTTLQEKIYNSTGYTAKIIRFPGGSSNTVSRKYCTGIMSQAVEYFSSTDFVYFDWNVDSDDAGSAKSIDEVYQNVTTSIIPGRDNVVLMHDSSSKIYTLGALEAIIDYGIENGYEFKAITTETPQVVHDVAN